MAWCETIQDICAPKPVIDASVVGISARKRAKEITGSFQIKVQTCSRALDALIHVYNFKAYVYVYVQSARGSLAEPITAKAVSSKSAGA